MALFLNLLWLIFGGLFLGFAWYIAGFIMAVTIIGLPWARACFEIGNLSFAPFGKRAVTADEMRLSKAFEQLDKTKIEGSTVLQGAGVIAAILWLPLGFVLFVSHILAGVLLCLTLIGIPFAIQHFKIAGFCVFPVGMRVIDQEGAEPIRARAEYLRNAGVYR